MKFQGPYHRESESMWDDSAGSKNLGKSVHVPRTPLVSLRPALGSCWIRELGLFSALQPAVLGEDKRGSPGRVMGAGVVTCGNTRD